MIISATDETINNTKPHTKEHQPFGDFYTSVCVQVLQVRMTQLSVGENPVYVERFHVT